VDVSNHLLLLESDPYEQTYLGLVLKALRANQNHKSLSRLYDEAKTRFTDVGEKLRETWQESISTNGVTFPTSLASV
jgi:hypothetical protein